MQLKQKQKNIALSERYIVWIGSSGMFGRSYIKYVAGVCQRRHMHMLRVCNRCMVYWYDVQAI